MSEFHYDHQQVEEKWLQFWTDEKLFSGTDLDSFKGSEDKDYLLYAFAYPSGSGLHVGHVEPQTALDILARYKRMQGRKVFFPVGWDAFGLPAENYAIKTGVPPAETTRKAIESFGRQVKRLGISYDWDTEIATNHPKYYRWTQWIFLQLYKKGLAYQKDGKVNWCPSCQTVLANEQVVNGLCERCDSEVVQKDLKQWYFKITQYRDELVDDLEKVDWPNATKSQQANWIGRSEGAEVDFKIKETSQNLKIFTTRLDTIFGATFMVISPEKFEELDLDGKIPAERREAVLAYVEAAFKKTEEDRKIGEKDKTGEDLGLKAVNPFNGEEIPIYVADYVLAGYGTGAIMAVPAHDQRDFDFAKKHGLEIKAVIKDKSLPEEEWEKVEKGELCVAAYGTLVNSGEFDGMDTKNAQSELLKKFPEIAKKTTNYKLRDWLISRQRYWGAPIPIVYDPEGNPHPVKEEHLPWMLPEDVDFKPTGESPLRSSEEFKSRVEELYGKGWTPEYDTMDTFVDSSWYYMRYCDPRNDERFAGESRVKSIMPADFYLIGPEHIVLHLLYSRFFTKFMRDEGYLNVDEPFQKMRHQGMILGPDGKKMSKSKGNVINPDDVIAEYGADTLRVYEMFMGPLEADKPWDTRAVAGVARFLKKYARLVMMEVEKYSGMELELLEERDELETKFHKMIKKVTDDLPELKFNTAIAYLMEFSNLWEKFSKENEKALLFTAEELLALIKVIAPLAPFMAEELYGQAKYAWNDLEAKTLGATACESEEAKAKRLFLEAVEFKKSVHLEDWPKYNAQLTVSNKIKLAVQVNGKLRAEFEWNSDQLDDKEAILEHAKSLNDLEKWLDAKEIKREIYVPGKLVNLVV